MAIKRIVHRTGFIGAAISTVATLLPVDAAFLAIVDATMDFAAGDYFYMTIEEDELIEEVRVTDMGAGYLVIERDPVAPQAFSMAAKYNTDLTVREVEERAAGLAPVSPISIIGSGVATVETDGAGNYTVTVNSPNIVGQNGIEVTQAFPDYTVGVDMSTGCCAGETAVGGEGGTYTFVGSGIAAVSELEGEVTISVPSPNFIGAGVQITGTWPNITFTIPAGAAGTMTGISVGNGLTLVGNPNVAPTISITPTGVVAGNYGGVVVNERGQITGIPVGWNPVTSVVVTADSGLQVTRVGGEVTVAGIDAAEGVKGVVALADADAPLDPDDVTTAVTPKLLAAVLSDAVGAEVTGGQTYSGEADADYTDTLPTTAVTLDLAAGEMALVFANVTVRDNANPTLAQNYGLALFAATGTRIQANKKLEQNQQSMTALVIGPFSDGVVVRTTAMPVGAAVVSHALHAIVF